MHKIVIKHELRIVIPLSKDVKRKKKKRKYISISILCSVCHKPEKQIKDFFSSELPDCSGETDSGVCSFVPPQKPDLEAQPKRITMLKVCSKDLFPRCPYFIICVCFFLFFHWSFQSCYQTEVASLLCGIRAWFRNLLLWATSRHVFFSLFNIFFSIQTEALVTTLTVNFSALFTMSAWFNLHVVCICKVCFALYV